MTLNACRKFYNKLSAIIFHLKTAPAAAAAAAVVVATMAVTTNYIHRTNKTAREQQFVTKTSTFSHTSPQKDTTMNANFKARQRRQTQQLAFETHINFQSSQLAAERES